MDCYSCGMINNMFFTIRGMIDKWGLASLCCEPLPDAPAVKFMANPVETVGSYLDMLANVRKEGQESVGNPKAAQAKHTAACRKCAMYTRADHSYSKQIRYINLSMYPAPCQAKCIYCPDDKTFHSTKQVLRAYEIIFDTIDLLEKRQLIASDARWQVSSGEITIHPYRERIMKLTKAKAATFYTNVFLFDELIARNLHENSASAINLSIDSGTSTTWKKVKGFDNYWHIIDNLAHYASYCSKPEQITLKYIVLPGINDNLDDFNCLATQMLCISILNLSCYFNKKLRNLIP